MMQRYVDIDASLPPAVDGIPSGAYVRSRAGGVTLDMRTPRGARVTFELSPIGARALAADLIAQANLTERI